MQDIMNFTQEYDELASSSALLDVCFVLILVFTAFKEFGSFVSCPEIYGLHEYKRGRYDSGSFARKQLDNLRIKCGQFPNPYPNGWYKLMESNELKINQTKVISALGHQFLLYRNALGSFSATFMHCRCGSDLSVLGNVRYRTKSLQCINCMSELFPYSKCKNKNASSLFSFPLIHLKNLETIFMWFHADQIADFNLAKQFSCTSSKPLWDLQIQLRELDQSVLQGKRYFSAVLDWKPDPLIHVFEAAQNTADEYHFITVHQFLPMPFNIKLLHVRHFTDVVYGKTSKTSTNKFNLVNDDPTVAIFGERIRSIKIFGIFQVPSFFLRGFVSTVFLQGPNNLLYNIQTPLGTVFTHVTFLPLEPFRQEARIKMFADSCVPKFVCWIMIWWIRETIKQDMQVWEHKLHISPRNLVIGDGPFAKFSNWLKTFYSEKSTAWKALAIEY
eukprot:snap_masked-scaffold_10-processed-gene-11.19-mRNA-1 protein AED:1.00 eAED:1.00 QI:0/-1/0/0/-1/1/1/0/443